jgi:hypothetical protein
MVMIAFVLLALKKRELNYNCLKTEKDLMIYQKDMQFLKLNLKKSKNIRDLVLHIMELNSAPLI